MEISQKISDGGEREAGGGQLDHHDRPQLPDHEAEELGEDGPVQVAPGDGAAGGLPLLLVLGIPVGDPAAGAEFKGGGVKGGRRCGGGTLGRHLRCRYLRCVQQSR